jgi:hypothetical protein
MPFAINATENGLEYFPRTNKNWAMSISRPEAKALTVEVQSWPDDPDLPRRWTETSSQSKGATQHIVAGLRPRARYQLKANGETIDSLRSDKNGRVRFTSRQNNSATQTFELSLTPLDTNS